MKSPHHFFSKVLPILAGLCAAPVTYADSAANDAEVVDGILGSCDRHGYGGFEIPLDHGAAAQSSTLPLLAKFNTGRKYIDQPSLGLGWWLPIIESTAVQVRESAVVIHLPDGTHKYLYSNPAKQDLYESRDLNWSGQQAGDEFEVIDPHKRVYQYKKGRLRQMALPDGEVWNWSGKEGVNEITSSTRGMLYRFVFDAKGLLQKIRSGDEELKVKYQQLPIVSGVAGFNQIAGIAQTLESIESANHSVCKLLVGTDAALENAKIDAVASRVHKEFHFSWEMATGFIQTEGDIRYHNTRPTGEVAPAQLERQFRDGSREVVNYDNQTGSLEVIGRDGVSKKFYNVMTPGSGYQQLRKVISTQPDGSAETEREAYFDPDGNILRKKTKTRWGFDQIIRSGTNFVCQPQVRDSTYYIVDSPAAKELWVQGASSPCARYLKDGVVERNIGNGYWSRFVIGEDGELLFTHHFLAKGQQGNMLSAEQIQRNRNN